MSWAQVLPVGALLALMGCGTTAASDDPPDAPAPEDVASNEDASLAVALGAGATEDWDAMLRRTHVKVSAVDETATAEDLSRVVAPAVEKGWLWMMKSTPRSACLCETTVTDRGRIREDGTLDLSIDHRPVWLIVYDGVLLPMTDSEQTVLTIIDPETGENSVQDLPYAPPASIGPG